MAQGSILNNWKNAATIMLLAKTADETWKLRGQEDYKILMLKRSKRSSAFPSTYVFPGGTLSDSDFSPEWKNVIPNFCKVQENLTIGGATSRPAVMSEFDQSSISPELGFRICAIRETFEECGILLVRPRDNIPENGKKGTITRKQLYLKSGFELDRWRRRIYDDASAFIDLCKELDVVPDIWSLIEWANVLSPVIQTVGEELRHRQRRFDTMFYIAFINHEPTADPDHGEITDCTWIQPSRALLGPISDDSLVITPQLYELSRLCGVKSWEDLVELSIHREGLGLERTVPYCIICTDGYIDLLPGDETYPEQYDYRGPSKDVPLVPGMSVQEFLARNPVRKAHRCISRFGVGPSWYDGTVLCNIDSVHGHPRPVNNGPLRSLL